MIIYHGDGNLIHSKMQSLVCTVNLVGTMGKGIALTLSKRYPGLIDFYRDEIRSDNLVGGNISVFRATNHTQIILLPTKVHWRNDSPYDLVFKSLEVLRDTYRDYDINSIATPVVGCGNGNLDRNIIIPAMYYYLDDIDIPVEIYEN